MPFKPKPANKYRPSAGAKGDPHARLKDIAARTYRGHVYHSKMEAAHASQLDMLRTAKDPKERVTYWGRQVAMPYKVNGALIATSFIDFIVHYGDGRVEYHEVKGVRTEGWRIKEKLFRACYPDRVLKIIR